MIVTSWEGGTFNSHILRWGVPVIVTSWEGVLMIVTFEVGYNIMEIMWIFHAVGFR